MSLNNAHSLNEANAIVLFAGERLLIFYKKCLINLTAKNLKITGTGRCYLTSHRVVWITNDLKSSTRSVSMPFVNMSMVDLKQPVLGANKIVGLCTSDNPNFWEDKASFSITFNDGGAVEFVKALVELGSRAHRGTTYTPPTYTESMYNPQINYEAAPAYQYPYSDPNYNFITAHDSFQIPQNYYQSSAPPPYPGVVFNQPPTYPNQNIGFSAPPAYNNSSYPPPAFSNPTTANLAQSYAPNSYQDMTPTPEPKPTAPFAEMKEKI